MWEPLEMVTASLMQDMVQIRGENIYLVTKLLCYFLEQVLLGLSALRAPRWGHYAGMFLGSADSRQINCRMLCGPEEAQPPRFSFDNKKTNK